MNQIPSILAELEQEAAGTRAVLSRIPADKWDWKAHPRSQTLGWNANHLAEIQGWIEGTLTQTAWDLAPPGEEAYQSPQLTSPGEVLELFDANLAAGRRALESASEESLAEPWSLLQGGNVLFTLPRAAVLRTFILNHIIHHRAHVCVYLRLNDVPVPGLYGQSGDEA